MVLRPAPLDDEPLIGMGGDKLGPLNGPLLTDPNGTYEVTFGAAVPAGDYKFTCTPHMAMGMKGKVTVQK